MKALALPDALHLQLTVLSAEVYVIALHVAPSVPHCNIGTCFSAFNNWKNPRGN